MKQKWVKRKQKEQEEKAEKIMREMQQFLKETIGEKYPDDAIKSLIDYVYDAGKRNYPLGPYKLLLPPDVIASMTDADIETHKTMCKDLVDVLSTHYEWYIDSDSEHYHGDIIITDPCYVIKDSDWSGLCGLLEHAYSKNIRYHGIPRTIMRDTLYGDWGCTTYDKRTKEELGSFCADSGMVAVFDLNEALKYNPDFDYHTERPWTTTLIKDFDGDVWFAIRQHRSKYCSNWYTVHVIGKGINIQTGEEIEFETRRTSL